MKFINSDTLRSIDVEEFHNRKPFPWINPHGLLTNDGYEKLLETLPAIEHLEKDFGKERKYHQTPHDRYRLRYSPDLTFLDAAWHDFVAELNGPEYRDFIQRLFGISQFSLRCEWHYAEKGAEVTPHLDGVSNYGAQLFYLMSEKDWKQEWGGQTLILGSDHSMAVNSNPNIDDFSQVIEANCLGNNTLLFQNSDVSWHAVRRFSQPVGTYRKIFTYFIKKPEPFKKRFKAAVARVLGLR